MLCITILPITGELNGRSLWLALLSDQHLIKKPTTTSTAAIMTYTHSAHLAQGHGLDDKLIMLREERENWLKMLAMPFLNNIY